MERFVLLACLIHATISAPQFVTFKDGNVGVNFGGYHAEAGLGGLLTGNAAHGGLRASAGTPWGQQAAAGLGGNVDGRAGGVAYAGAQASPSVGASALIGGNTGHRGFAGSEAHAHKHVVTKSVGAQETITTSPVIGNRILTPEDTNSVQKIKPPKKYSLIHDEHHIRPEANVVHSKQLIKTYSAVPAPVATVTDDTALGHSSTTTGVNVHYDTGLVGNILNIPIGILRSLQESLSGIRVDKTISHTKTV